MEHFICRTSDISGKVHWDLIQEGSPEPLLFGQQETSVEELFVSIQELKNCTEREDCFSRYRGLDHYYFDMSGSDGRILAKSRRFNSNEEMETVIRKLREVVPSASIRILSQTCDLR